MITLGGQRTGEHSDPLTSREIERVGKRVSGWAGPDLDLGFPRHADSQVRYRAFSLDSLGLARDKTTGPTNLLGH